MTSKDGILDLLAYQRQPADILTPTKSLTGESFDGFLAIYILLDGMIELIGNKLRVDRQFMQSLPQNPFILTLQLNSFSTI
jgi:hypothetical protein